MDATTDNGAITPANLALAATPEPDADDRAVCSRCGDLYGSDAFPLTSPRLCTPCVLSFHEPWSPRLIGAISFLTGFGGAGILHSLNARRFGARRSVALPIALWVTAFVAFATFMVAAPERAGNSIAMVVNIGLALFFSHARRNRFEAYTASGGKAGSGWKAFGVGAGTTAAVLLTVVVGYVVVTTMRFDQAATAMNQGELDEAFETFEDLCEDEDEAACTNAGFIDEQRGNVESARLFYERGCARGEPVGCTNLASLLEQGVGGAVDANRARELYQRACDAGDPTACDALSL